MTEETMSIGVRLSYPEIEILDRLADDLAKAKTAESGKPVRPSRSAVAADLIRKQLAEDEALQALPKLAGADVA